MFYLLMVFALCVVATILDTAMTKPGRIDSSADQRKINIATICLLIYIAGFRNMGGTDLYVYAIAYNNAPKLGEFFEYYAVLDEKFFLFGLDRGYVFINSFMKTIGFTYYGFNFCHSLFCFILIYIGTRRYTNNFSIVIMVLLYKMFFYDFFVSLRQTITIAIFFCMLGDIEKKHPMRYFLMCLLCYWIHAASIVLFAVYFVRYIKLSKNLITVLNAIFIPTLFISALNLPVLKIFEGVLNWNIFGSEEIVEKATGLITDDPNVGIDWLHTAEYFGMMFLLLLNYDDIKREYPQSDMMIKLFLCLLPIFTIFRNYVILTRWKDYFTISYGFIFSWLAYINNKRSRLTVLLLVIIWTAIGYFRYINVFDGGAFYNYFPIQGLVDFYNLPF